MSRLVLGLLCVLLPALALPAAAQLRLYGGVSAGLAAAEIDGVDEIDGLRLDDDDFAYKLFAGVRIGRHLGVETSYRDLGSVDGDGVIPFTVALDGYDAFFVPRLTFGPVTLFGKAGAFFWNGSARGPGEVRLSQDGTDLAWGVGVSVKLLMISLRTEYEAFEIDAAADLAMVSVGATIGF